MKTILFLFLSFMTLSSPLNKETTQDVIPMKENPMNYSINAHRIEKKSVDFNTTYNSSGLYTSSNRSINVYGGSSNSVGITNFNNSTRQLNSVNSVAPSISYAKDKNCQYCNGTGYINDYGEGELAYGKWYFQTDDRYGDGTSCTDKTGYHDECDVESQGEIYHHFAKRTCPYCNGTGKNPDRVGGWTSWTGWAWSHAFGDEDHNGHCDEHYWHAPIGNGVAIFFILLLVYSLFLLIKNDAKKDITE